MRSSGWREVLSLPYDGRGRDSAGAEDRLLGDGTAYEKLKLTSEEHGGGGGLRGEAVVVETADGPIFVLLKNDGSGQSLQAQVTAALAPGAPLNPIASYVATVGDLGGMFANAKAELPREVWPLMVRFRDIDDPESVGKVDPEAAGVKRIWLETTSDDVTTGIEKRLPGYGAGSGFDVWYANLSMGDPRRVAIDDFRKEI